jgi:hypothetical protein
VRILISILLGLAVGAVAGWLLAPRMHVPRMGKEELLRQRAVAYYAASRRLDRLGMLRLTTPARQLAQADKLREDARKIAETAARQPADQRREAEETAAGIKPEDIEVQLEGNWATTTGKYNLIIAGQKIPSQLDRTLWVYDDGQWWQYSFEPPERNAYGHPPDFAMDMDPWK